MAKKPPRPDRGVNGDISVDLKDFLQRLARATGWEGDLDALGRPGTYESGRRGCDTAPEFAVDYLFQEIMSKFDDELAESDSLKEREALVKFYEAEAACKETNVWFDRHAQFGNELKTPPDCDPDVWQALLLARRKLESWLGPFDWDEIAAGFRFTYGASVKMPRARSAPAHKYSKSMEITPAAEALGRACLMFYPAWGAHLGTETPFEVVKGNRLLCVPKNYKVHRIIACEPSLNMFVQKGFGLALRRRLRAIGIDLHSQVMNQNFALLGSVTDLVATVDLSMASDTISKGLVEWAFPSQWTEAMSLCRSPIGVLPSGEEVLYRKWSSMGNAYTFEMETALFAALTQACTQITGHDTHFTTCYGDDIICPSGASDLLFRVLRRCGFKPNEKKSFVSGPFRESCGKHYFRGADVTPFYIRRQPRKLIDLFLLVNNLRRWAERVRAVLPEPVYLAVMALVARYRSFAPSKWRRPRIPDGYGDGAFIGTFDECLPRRPRGKWLWWEGWQVEVISSSAPGIKSGREDQHFNVNGVMLAMLEKLEYGPPCLAVDTDLINDDLESVPGGVLPDRRRRYATTTMIVAQF